MPEKMCELEGIEFDKSEITALVEMFRSKGYQQYQRIFEAIKKGDVSATLGNPKAYKLETFLHTQGAYCLLNELEHLPESAENVSQELEELGEEEKK